MKDILKLYKDLHKSVYQDKTITIGLEVPGMTAFIDTFKFYDYQFYDDKKSIELSSINSNDTFTIDLTKLVECTQYEETYGIGYYLKFESFVLDISIME